MYEAAGISPEITGRGGLQEITEYELKIAALIAEGFTYEEMGAKLGISARSAKYRTDLLRRKLEVRNKRAIPRLLRSLGIM